jgi:hypothetical protein
MLMSEHPPTPPDNESDQASDEEISDVEEARVEEVSRDQPPLDQPPLSEYERARIELEKMDSSPEPASDSLDEQLVEARRQRDRLEERVKEEALRHQQETEDSQQRFN